MRTFIKYYFLLQVLIGLVLTQYVSLSADYSMLVFVWWTYGILGLPASFSVPFIMVEFVSLIDEIPKEYEGEHSFLWVFLYITAPSILFTVVNTAQWWLVYKIFQLLLRWRRSEKKF